MKYYRPCNDDENPYIDLTPYKEVIKDSDANLIVGSEGYKVAIVMLYGAVNRLFNANALAWHTNTKHKITIKAVRNLKACGIWVQKGKKLKHELFTKWVNSGKDKELKQVILFWLDVCVAEGNIVKIKNKYGLKEWAQPSYSKKLKNRLKWIALKQYEISNKK